MTIERTKAGFRALRDLCGVTQDELAQVLSCDLKTVQRLESPRREDMQPREEDWRALEQLRRTQVAQLDYAMQTVERAIDSGTRPHVDIPYFRTQAAYDSEGRDAGSFRLANRVAGEVAEALDEMGVEVTLFYAGEEPSETWETVKATTR